MSERDELAGIVYKARWVDGIKDVNLMTDAAIADKIIAAGYRKPQPPTAESVDAAAQAVYAITPSSQTIAWELLPRIVQHEFRTIALTAINAANMIEVES